jgi:hypothetical protein
MCRSESDHRDDKVFIHVIALQRAVNGLASVWRGDARHETTFTFPSTSRSGRHIPIFYQCVHTGKDLPLSKILLRDSI